MTTENTKETESTGDPKLHPSEDMIICVVSERARICRPGLKAALRTAEEFKHRGFHLETISGKVIAEFAPVPRKETTPEDGG